VSRNRAAAISAVVALVLGTVLMLAWRDWIEPRLKGRPQAPKTMPLTSFAGDETQPAFSPDGSRIAFVWGGENNDNSDIYMKPVRGVGLTRITTDAAEDVSPTWSADGSQIAFLRATETETAVFVSASSAGAVHGRITSLYPNRIEAVGRHLDWSPNGKYLAAADKKTPDEPFSIVLIEVGTGHKIQITDPPSGTVGDSNPAVSPDGLSVAFIRAVSSGVDDIFVVPITGGPVRRITTDKRYVISLAWAADGNSILFSSNRAGNHSLWRIPTAGGTPERVAAVGQNSSDPVFSRDGKLMAYSQFYMDSNIWRMDLVTGQTRKLIASTQYDSSPQYSPDGKRIAFRSSRSGGNEIWVAQADGTVDRQLTNFSSTLSGTPRWSPDGRFLAFDSRPEGQPDIFVVDVEEGSLRKATSDPGEDVVPSWSRDGNWIYFSSNRGGSWQVWKTPAKGGADQQVSKQGGFGPFESSDGFIYYAKGRSVAGLWRMRLDGSNEERILERLKPAYWGYWGLAPQGILFVDREASSYALYLYQPGRPAPVRLAAFDKPVIPGDAGLGVSPSGREVLYTQLDQSGSDIMLVDAPLAGK
jgi:Tol biopolymer transport system component